MRIAVLSGKGGAGKTFVSVNLAKSIEKSTYVDCDVEEPNGHLFMKPENLTEETVYRTLPDFDGEKCTGCRKCTDFCRFHALIYIKNKPVVFNEVCHSCGGCSMVCPENAITEKKIPVGSISTGSSGSNKVISGMLNIGEASAIPVINAALSKAFSYGGTTIADCPPGSACSVMESVSLCDYCILVCEPTAFGFHNFKMVYELVNLLGKPCGVVINKMEEPYEPAESFCREHKIPVLARIPYRKSTAEAVSHGDIASGLDSGLRDQFRKLAGHFEMLAEKTGGVQL